MIATGNHNFEKFAALCNTPGGSQGVQTISVYALLQGICVHPGACKNPGLRAAISRPYNCGGEPTPTKTAVRDEPNGGILYEL